ncbi:MAG: hypothetical protein C0603_04860 [Denitrovibrio sp.]|nr:MAG: hypothetical protein C0603_04860 [Denitrovibrio sp.]
MYIPLMDNKSAFQNYFDMTQKLYRTMVYALFIYPLFVAAVETFHFAVFRFLNFETMQKMGLVFMVLTILSFPLAYISDSFFIKGCLNTHQLGRKMMFSAIAKMAMSETITLFGLIIYITSANLKFFYLFFIISFVHILAVRPAQKRWQRQLDSFV